MKNLVRFSATSLAACSALLVARAASAGCTSGDGANCYEVFSAEEALTGIGETFESIYPCTSDAACSPYCVSHPSDSDCYQYVASNHSNFAYMPPSGPATKLLLFFPGGGTSTDEYTDFMNEAANIGFRVLGMTYENVRKPEQCNPAACCTSSSSTCDPSCAPYFDFYAQDRCFTDLFEEKVWGVYSGTDEPPWFEAQDANGNAIWNYGNGVQERLYAALVYLDSTHPNDGWGQFIDTSNGEIDWTMMRVSGHSQGSKISVVIAAEYDVKRAALFGGDSDAVVSSNGTSATPIYIPSYIRSGATASAGYFDFDREDSFTFPGTSTNWGTGLNAGGATVGLDLPRTPRTARGYVAAQACQDVSGLTQSQLVDNRFTASATDPLYCDIDNATTSAHYESIANCSNYQYQYVWDYMLTHIVP